MSHINPINSEHSFGWIPQKHDHRDIPYMATRCSVQIAPVELPEEVDLRQYCPPIFNQGQLGSCTANGILGLYQIDLLKNLIASSAVTLEHFEAYRDDPVVSPTDDLSNAILSRLFLYYNERAMEGTTGYDAGANIRDGIKSLNTQGCCKEALWPYRIGEYTQKPPSNAYTDALSHKSVLYAAVHNNAQEIKTVLADGYAVVFGFTVYESFEGQQIASTGIMPLPKSGERVLGGHCVVIVGYKLINGNLYFICRNSWGAQWGDKGYFYMPASFMPANASDFWTIKSVNPI